MEVGEYEIMYKAEDRHWWYLGMTDITRGVLDRWIGRNKQLAILDAGCGTGSILQTLQDYGAPTGIDTHTEALQFCKMRRLTRLCQASITHLPFPDGTFDLITSFDVLSEVGHPRDEQGLDEFLRVLKPGGHLLLRLPAYSWLRGQHDERVHTRRRYTRRQLERMLPAHGFEVLETSYANTLLFPLAAAKRLSEKILKPTHEGSDLTLPTGFLNRVFKALLSAEAPLIRTVGLPFGMTLVALARKPG
jgi:SAM-dependent methyltransferase